MGQGPIMLVAKVTGTCENPLLSDIDPDRQRFGCLCPDPSASYLW